MPSKNNNREYVKALAKRIVEHSSYDQDSNTLFVTNPGISAELLKRLAKKQGFRVDHEHLHYANGEVVICEK